MSQGINCGVAGLFMLEAVNKDTGERRTLAPWFPNLITDAGLNRMGTGGVLDNCVVGSGSNPPVVADTALQSQVAITTTKLTNNLRTAQSTEPYYGTNTNVYRFDVGVAAGNLSEVGIGWTGGLFSRSLIKDGLGNPTTVTVLANEYLDVTYEIRVYPPTTDTNFQVVSAQGVTHNCVVRASRVTNWLYWPSFATNDGASFTTSARAYTVGAVHLISNGTIGPITSTVQGTTGSESNNITTSNAAYVDLSLERSATLTLLPQHGNLAGGISAMRVAFSLGEFQYSFDPPIVKTNVQTLTLNVKVSWARKVI